MLLLHKFIQFSLAALESKHRVQHKISVLIHTVGVGVLGKLQLVLVKAEQTANLLYLIYCHKIFKQNLFRRRQFVLVKILALDIGHRGLEIRILHRHRSSGMESIARVVVALRMRLELWLWHHPGVIYHCFVPQKVSCGEYSIHGLPVFNCILMVPRI